MAVESINDVADAFQSLVQGLDSDVRAYSTAEEKVAGEIGAEIYIHNRQPTGPSYALWDAEVRIALSTPANRGGWSGAIRRIRELLDAQGDRSIQAAVDADMTLGGVFRSALFDRYGDERRTKYDDGIRWTADIFFNVKFEYAE